MLDRIVSIISSIVPGATRNQAWLVIGGIIALLAGVLLWADRALIHLLDRMF